MITGGAASVPSGLKRRRILTSVCCADSPPASRFHFDCTHCRIRWARMASSLADTWRSRPSGAPSTGPFGSALACSSSGTDGRGAPLSGTLFNSAAIFSASNFFLASASLRFFSSSRLRLSSASLRRFSSSSFRLSSACLRSSSSRLCSSIFFCSSSFLCSSAWRSCSFSSSSTFFCSSASCAGRAGPRRDGGRCWWMRRGRLLLGLFFRLLLGLFLGLLLGLCLGLLLGRLRLWRRRRGGGRWGRLGGLLLGGLRLRCLLGLRLKLLG